MNWLKLFVLLLEWGVQLKRRDDETKREERLLLAKTNPGDYLRQFGWVQHVTDPQNPMRGNSSSANECDRE